MAHDVFISYSEKDKTIANAVCTKLESNGVRCWVAPRDIPAGGLFAEEIIKAINNSRILVLIFSSNSNSSHYVNAELEQALDRCLAIIPFRIDEVNPTGRMKLCLSGRHWLDAMTPPLENHLNTLVEAVRRLISLNSPEELRDSVIDNYSELDKQTPDKSGQRFYKIKSYLRGIRSKHWLWIAMLISIFIIVLLLGKIPKPGESLNSAAKNNPIVAATPPGPGATSGQIETPVDKSEVRRGFDIEGTIYNRPRHLWIIQRIGNMHWPKEPELQPFRNRWRGEVNVGGRPPQGRLEILLVDVPDEVSRMFMAWLEKGYRTGDFSGITTRELGDMKILDQKEYRLID